jgi:hypothetical protein
VVQIVRWATLNRIGILRAEYSGLVEYDHLEQDMIWAVLVVEKKHTYYNRVSGQLLSIPVDAWNRAKPRDEEIVLG